MMKDTVSDMRRHIWPEDTSASTDSSEEIDRKTEEKIEAFRGEMTNELSTLFSRQRTADGKLEAIKGEMKNLIEKAISGSIEVDREVREETVKNAILIAIKRLSRIKKNVVAIDILKRLEERFPINIVVRALESMTEEDILSN